MKKTQRLLITLSFLLIAQITSFSQNTDWVRVQSDNGEFSVEVPSNSSYFFDKEGFQTAFESNNYLMKQVSILNAYYDKTLISFESYEASANALKGIVRDDKNRGNYSKLTINGSSIEQIITKSDDFYSIRWYFSSKKFIYILTAAAKTENQRMKRFLDSLIFKPINKEPIDPKISTFSKLRVTQIKIDDLQKEADKIKEFYAELQKRNKENDKLKKLVIVSKVRASYVDSARMKGIQGKVILQAEFMDDGTINNIGILKPLPEGLLRQTIFALLRIKFLPQEENGEPKNVKKVIEYSFSIY